MKTHNELLKGKIAQCNEKRISNVREIEKLGFLSSIEASWH